MRIDRETRVQMLEAAHASAHASAVRLASPPASGTPSDPRAVRLHANARRASVMLVEEIGGLKTPTDVADYRRAAHLLAPVEAAIRAEAAAWDRTPDFVLHSGGLALKLASTTRVQLLLAVAYERCGLRDEADALHGLGSARSGGKVRSLHHDAVSAVRGTRRTLRARGFWPRDELPDGSRALVGALTNAWQGIAREAHAAVEAGRLLRTDENLAASSRDWLQLDLRKRGAPIAENCALAPSTCRLLEAHAKALSPMGQAKLSAIIGGTRIYPHAGPTNGRLRLHLGLHVPEEGYVITVDGVNASWAPGEVLAIDDSLVHEVYTPPHGGVPSIRIVLIVDMHHPDLEEAERQRVRPLGNRRRS